MARFFFHVFNGHGHVADDEGQELDDRSTARDVAVDSVRSMVSEDARGGLIDLSGYIAVKDAAQQVVLTVPYSEAFELRFPNKASMADD